VLGDDGERCHDVSLLLSAVGETMVAFARFPGLSSSFPTLVATGSEAAAKMYLCGRLVVELSGRA
jgi:hypothetical protein